MIGNHYLSIARLGLLSGLIEQELIYIKEREVCNNGYGCDCEKLHLVNCKNWMTIIAIGWTRGNKKASATILPIEFENTDIASTHKIMKRHWHRIYRYEKNSLQCHAI